MLKNLILKSLLNLPGPIVRLLAGGRIIRDGQELDSQSQMINFLLAKLAKGPVEQQTVEGNRKSFHRFSKFIPPSPVKDVQDHTVPGPAGPIPIRIYKPKQAVANGPAVVYFHGGGWVLGDFQTYDFTCGTLAHESGCVVIAVDYRLAPEHIYPAAIDDCFAAFQEIAKRAPEFDIDAKLIAVAGDSAGGNLAAAVCQLNQSFGSIQACFQLLIYPATDLSKDSQSRQLFADGFLLSTPALHWFMDQYTPNPSARSEAKISPLLAKSLKGLPPALLILAGFDPLRDEGLQYADRLNAEGVPAHCELHASTIHGFFSMPHLEVSKTAMTQACIALQNAFSD